MKMNLTGAIEILKLHKHTTDKFKHSVGDQYLSDAIDTVVKEVCDHHFLPIGEWDGVMMIMCTKCNLYKEGERKKTCVHPYAMVYGGCGKPERCLLCGEILSD